MKEEALHFIWKFQKFDRNNLSTKKGDQIKIFNPGIHNHDSGPDFSSAKIRIGEIEWFGNVEIHINSSDWIHHNHQSDKAYDNVILHVVWKEDREVFRPDGSSIPTLELQEILDQKWLTEYDKFISSPYKILCQNQINDVPESIKYGWLDRMASERLEEKANRVIDILQASNGDWEECAYRLLCRNFGFSVNAQSFEILAETLPRSIIYKNVYDPKKVMALVFGQAGFLEEETKDEYNFALLKEYEYLKIKYDLTQKLSRFHWKFSKMRPANFPTVRLAQLSQILIQYPSLFIFFLEIQDSKGLAEALNESLINSYWRDHYDFGKKQSREKLLGISTIDNLIINTVAPLLMAYGRETGEIKYQEKAIDLLESISPEKNRITKIWDALAFEAKNALDSQGQLNLLNNYCERKKCLQCEIGNQILRG